MRRVLAVLVVIAILPLGYYAYANPEKRTLNEAARAEAPGQFVTLDAGVTHYEIAGPDTGRVAVLVHGFSVPYYIWDSTFYALAAAGHRVLRYDTFGRGWSDRPDAAYDGAFFDSQLTGLLDSLRITEPVDLFGLSFGGFISAHFASTHSARVRTLVLVDPATTPLQLPSIIATPVIGSYLWQVKAVPSMPAGQPTDFLHPERFPGWAERYLPQMQFRGFGRALRQSILAQKSADYPAMYATIAASGTPVLLIWGRQDATLPFANAEHVTRVITTTEFLPVDSAGHLPHLEQAPLVNARLFSFLAAHPRASAPE
jgi:pimeloyl-ACP methyl ester carboxylesterase